MAEMEFELDEKKQAAADVLSDYSLFTMACIGEGVRPAHLRMHLMKEISGMPTSLKKNHYQPQVAQIKPPVKVEKASSSSASEQQASSSGKSLAKKDV